MARGSIVKRPSGNYAIVYYVNNKQKWKTIGPNKKEAEKALRDIMGSVDNGTYRELKSVPFSKFCDKWLAERESRVKRSTFEFYEGIARCHLKPYFKERPLHQIRAEDIERYLSFKHKEAKLSPKTIGYHLTVLRMIFKKAILYERVKQNPAQLVEKPRCEKFEMQILKPAEVRIFLENVDERYYPFFLTAIMTGLRMGELLGLRWSDINWFSKQIHVKRSVSLNEVQEPKTKNSIRKIDISPVLVETLKEHKKRLKVESLSFGEDDLVFPNEQGGLLDRHNIYSRYFIPALKKAGLPLIRFHDLRHTYISFLIYQGENLKYVQTQAGHASITTTLDRYSHLIQDAHNGASERLEKTIFKISSEKTELLEYDSTEIKG